MTEDELIKEYPEWNGKLKTEHMASAKIPKGPTEFKVTIEFISTGFDIMRNTHITDPERIKESWATRLQHMHEPKIKNAKITVTKHD